VAAHTGLLDRLSLAGHWLNEASHRLVEAMYLNRTAYSSGPTRKATIIRTKGEPSIAKAVPPRQRVRVEEFLLRLNHLAERSNWGTIYGP